ncbi:MAG: magnesium-translocating P-type ATPase [Phycisphaerales bacterium]|nr:magnesium-translocating P-type ATPase [Phycisphaerales bacterium]
MEKQSFWSAATDQLLKQLGTSAEGLSPTEAQHRYDQVRHLKPHRATVWSLLWSQVKNPINILLFCIAVLAFFLPEEQDTFYMILFILIASALLNFWHEKGAADAVAKLLKMIETKATVIRGGKDHEISLDEIVPGDVVRLRAGDLIPGDCRLLSSRDLFLNEAMLTGESFPAEKSCTELPSDTPLGKRTNSVFLGTNVISGFATAVVIGTGPDTEFGKISERLERKSPETDFERGLKQFSKLIIKVVIALTAAVFFVKLGIKNEGVNEALIFALAIGIGMAPELLPAITSVVLAAGAKAMAKQKVIVKKLLAIENFGGMTVLCSDKTGTLTEGVMRLQETLDTSGQPSEQIARFAYLNAFLQTGFVNPIDQAICQRQTFNTDTVEKLDEIPYDFRRRRLSVRVSEGNHKLLITKGALANVLECCSEVMLPSGKSVALAEKHAEIQNRFTEMSHQGLRVLGLAVRAIDAPRVTKEDERDMTFLGFLVFADPPKADAPEMIAQLRDLGVALKIITGDNHAVAATVSHQVGIAEPVVITGSELRELSDDALVQRVRDVDVFAEIEPNQKEQIVLALKKSGEVVGYLGDGINDASAIHAADVGISVASAVDVAKEAAQIVLLQSGLDVLVRGVRTGRQAFTNTLKYIFYVIAANFGYMFSLAVASMVFPFDPMTAIQILFVNLLADFPAMALAFDNVDTEQVQKPVRWNVRFIVKFMLSFGFTSAVFDFMIFGFMFYFWRYQYAAWRKVGTVWENLSTGWENLLAGKKEMAESWKDLTEVPEGAIETARQALDAAQQAIATAEPAMETASKVVMEAKNAFVLPFQTGWFIESTLAGLMILFIVRTRRPFFMSKPGLLFLGAVLAVAAITIVLPYTPIGQSKLGLVLPPPELMIAIAVVILLYGIGMELVKRWFYRKLAA